MQPLHVIRKRQRFTSDASRVIIKFFAPHGEHRKEHIIQRVLGLSEEDCDAILQEVLIGFAERHCNFETELLDNYRQIEYLLEYPDALSDARKLLLGAYFTHEYSIESTALFNPSIVPHPSQDNAPEGSLRCILSFRAIGEGHISSLVFRAGTLDAQNHFLMDPVSPFVLTPEVELNPTYDKHTFLMKLEELDEQPNEQHEYINRIFEKLPSKFHFDTLKEKLLEEKSENLFSLEIEKAIEMIFWVARSNYEVNFSPQSRPSERVIFPVARSESNGIEDARFVRFIDDDGDICYYATYTAYNGHAILPMLLETREFLHFKMCTLNGDAAKDKDFALFPRKINGQYAMISRQDGENLYMMFSDNLHFWHEMHLLQTPQSAWEFIQMGSCGSPLETEAGWLLLTHGVGPLRKYCIGAYLLDLHDPLRVIGRLEEPLIMPNEHEREGYVPNVVYTCGAIIHHDTLVIPYAVSDTASGIATVRLQPLLERLLGQSG